MLRRVVLHRRLALRQIDGKQAEQRLPQAVDTHAELRLLWSAKQGQPWRKLVEQVGPLLLFVAEWLLAASMVLAVQWKLQGAPGVPCKRPVDP